MVGIAYVVECNVIVYVIALYCRMSFNCLCNFLVTDTTWGAFPIQIAHTSIATLFLRLQKVPFEIMLIDNHFLKHSGNT